MLLRLFPNKWDNDENSYGGKQTKKEKMQSSVHNCKKKKFTLQIFLFSKSNLKE